MVSAALLKAGVPLPPLRHRRTTNGTLRHGHLF